MQTLYHIPDHNVFHIHGAIKALKDLEKVTEDYKKDFLAIYTPEVGPEEALDAFEIINCPEFQNMYIRQELQFGAVINKEKELKKINQLRLLAKMSEISV